MANPTNFRVLLADDHPLIMAGFAMALAADHVDVVGQARNAAEAIKMYHALRPDVAVLDIRYSTGPNGFEAARAMLAHDPGANIVFLSQFDQDTMIIESYRLGARAFVTKGSDPIQLAEAIRFAAEGKTYFLPGIPEHLVHLVVCGKGSPIAQLEPRETEIFKLMAQGKTYNEIAEQLSLSVRTIGIASQAIKEKMGQFGIHRNADFTLLAVKYGLIDP